MKLMIMFTVWTVGHSTRSGEEFGKILEAHGIQAAPGFENAGTHDYRLTSGSPAVDSGRHVAGVTEGFSGSAPDRGAIER